MYLRITALFTLLLVFIFASAVSAAEGNDIKVHLLTSSSVKIVSASNKFFVSVPDSASPQPVNGSLEFSLKPEGISLPQVSPSVRMTISSNDPFMSVNGKNYRGIVVLVQKNKDSFFVINNLNVEDYLAGVLGGEMPSSWHIEALKAQAVAARTYAVMMKRNPRNPDFDLFSTTMDQVYTGVSGEVPSILQAVSETKGEILAFDSVPINAFFHSTCSGSTCDVADVFSGNAPYLKAVPCNYCGSSSSSSWQYEISRKELSGLLKSKGIISGELYSLKIARKDASGRAAEVALSTSDGEKIVRGADLRMAIGPGKQKSTRYSIGQTLLPGDKDKVLILLLKTVIKREAIPGVPSEEEPVTTKGIEIDGQSDVQNTIDSLTSQSESAGLNLSSFPVVVVKPELVEMKEYSLFKFIGSGWGHGVGMCQWGAYGMAKQGIGYREILSHYYPGAVLQQTDSEVKPQG